MNIFENDMQVEAHNTAEERAHQEAQRRATSLVQEVCASVRKAAARRYGLLTEKFVREIGQAAYNVAYSQIYDATYESSFRCKYDDLVRDARRRKAEARKAAKEEARLNAAKTQKLNAMFGMDPEAQQ